MKKNTDFTQIGLCQIHPSARILSGAVIGKSYRRFLDGTYETPSVPTQIGANVYIGYYSLIGCESILKKDVIVDDHCLVESRVVVGESSLVTYRAQICNDAKIGRQCVIGGFIGERTQVGKMCRVFGQVIHSQHNPKLGWDDEDAMEASPVIEDCAFVGFKASVIGPVTIGRKAYVCAGAIVTRDVPASHIASCVNQIVPYSDWKGPLKCSPFFMAAE